MIRPVLHSRLFRLLREAVAWLLLTLFVLPVGSVEAALERARSERGIRHLAPLHAAAFDERLAEANERLLRTLALAAVPGLKRDELAEDLDESSRSFHLHPQALRASGRSQRFDPGITSGTFIAARVEKDENGREVVRWVRPLTELRLSGPFPDLKLLRHADRVELLPLIAPGAPDDPPLPCDPPGSCEQPLSSDLPLWSLDERKDLDESQGTRPRWVAPDEPVPYEIELSIPAPRRILILVLPKESAGLVIAIPGFRPSPTTARRVLLATVLQTRTSRNFMASAPSFFGDRGFSPVSVAKPLCARALREKGRVGNRQGKKSFILDLGGCTLTDVDPADGSSVLGATVTVHGHSGSARSISIRVPNPGTNPTTYSEFAAPLADGTFAAGDVPLPLIGDNALQLVCVDGAGSSQTKTLHVFRLGGSGPTVRIASPSAGTLTGAATVAVSGTVSDPAAKVYVNGQVARVTAPVAPATAATFALTSTALAEGPNVLYALATDSSGRGGEDRAVVSRDSAAPKVQITSPIAGAFLGRASSVVGAAPTVDVTGVVEVDTEPNLQSVVVSSSTSGGTPSASVTATVDPATGAFIARSVPLASLSSTQPTPQTITVTATDSLSHAGTQSVAVTFDPAGPALVLSQPLDAARFTETAAASINVTGGAWAHAGARITVNGGALDPSTLTWDSPASDGRQHAAFSVSIATPTTDGAFGVIARVEETTGKFASARRVLYKDTTAPTVVELVPADGAGLVDPNSLPLALFSENVLAGSLSSANGLTLTRLTGASAGEAVVGTYAIAGTAVAFVPGAALLRGERYRLRAGTGITDLAGHPLAAAKDSAFTVALSQTGVAPTLDAVAPIVCATTLKVKGSAVPSSSVRVRDEELVFSGTADATGRFEIEIPLSKNGFHHLHVFCVARDGSTSPEATSLFRVDCSAPLVSSSALDRTTGKLTVTFSEAMNLTTLSVGASGSGSGNAITVSDAEDATHASRTSQPAALSSDVSGATVATLDLGNASDAWWRTKSVRLEVGPPAADLEGNAMLARYETIFFVGAGPGDLSGGFLSGEVYDDETGRPLAGADVALYASSAPLPGSVAPSGLAAPTGSATTDGRGRYSFAGDVVAGRYALLLSHAGYTHVVRRLPLEPATGAVPFDGRLTPLAAVTALNLASVASISGPAGSSLLFEAPAASIAVSGSTGVNVQLTPLSGQALPELLPLGYTPIAAADVRLATTSSPDVALPEGVLTPFPSGSSTSSSTVKLTLPLPTGLISTTPIVAVRYDLSSGLWLTLAEIERISPSGSGPALVRVALVGPGTVALVVADASAATRPPAIATGIGVALVGSTLPSSLPTLTGTLSLDPPVVSPSGRSTARVVAKSADGTTAWPSGLAVSAYLDEKLILSGGGELYESPFSADLVLYHPILTAAELGSTAPEAAGAMSFRVSPSPRAAQVLLQSGYDNIRLFPFPESLERGQILGPAGGSITSPDGVELVVPEGALSERAIVKVRLLTSAELAAQPVPAGYDLTAAVRVDLAGLALARAATLKVKTPSGLAADASGDARFVFASWNESPADGRGAFARLISRASRTGAGTTTDTIVASPESATSTLPLEGLVREGIFLILHAKNPIGYATGLVKLENGFGLAGARATAAGLGTADLSAPGGTYALVVLEGPNQSLEALHPTLAEKGTATIASLARGATAPIDIVVKRIPPVITSRLPIPSSVDQLVGTSIVATFDRPLDPASVSSSTLKLELANSDGTSTGASVTGAVSLVDGISVVFTPSFRLAGGRKYLVSFMGGVRSAAGTAYQGAVPDAWTFTTKADATGGGQIHAEKIHLEIPINGVARIVGDAGALPGTGWSVTVDVSAPVVCTSQSTVPASADGSFTYLAGCPPTVPVTLSSILYLKALDPSGGITQIKLGPFVTPDGKGFVAQAGEETSFTTADGVIVRAPAGAFSVPTLVKVTTRPATTDVSLPADLKVAAVVDVDFEGEAKETIRLKIPVTTTAPVGTVVFAGSSIQAPWGRKLQMLDLARVIVDSTGQKFISNAEEDQPTESATSSQKRALGVRPQAITQSLIRTILAEFTARATGVFVLSTGALFAAITGEAQIGELGKEFDMIFNLVADSFVYRPLAHDWSGNYILPTIVGSPFRIVERNLSTGWIVAQQDYAAVTGSGGSLIRVAEFGSGSSAPPTLLDGSPFRVLRFDAPLSSGTLSCQALRLEVEACRTNNGMVIIRSTGSEFPLADGSEVSLFNLAGNTAGGTSRVSGGIFPDLTIQVADNDELMALISPGDLDPGTFGDFTLIFSRSFKAITGLSTFATLADCGPASVAGPCQNILIPVAVSEGGDRIVIEPVGSLARGHRFRLEFNRDKVKAAGPNGDVSYPASSPSAFNFATREAPQQPIGTLPGMPGAPFSLGDTDGARDLLKFGNLLMIGSATGKILAIDVSNPSKLQRFAILNNQDSSVRAFATDGHNRLFYNAGQNITWGLRAIRIEDVRTATSQACVTDPVPPAWQQGLPCFDSVLGGVRTAFAPGFTSGLLGSEFLSLTGSLPTGTPTSMQIVVEDDSERPSELRAFYAAHVTGTAFDALAPDADGIYTFSMSLNTTGHRAPRQAPCTGEEAWDHYQRVSIDNLTTGQTWSFDVRNPWSYSDSQPDSTSGPGDGTRVVTGIRARRGDTLRVRYNLRAYGYIAILGSGISVVDLNRFYRTPLVAGAGGANNIGECGRRLGKFEGQDILFADCGNATNDGSGIANTSDLSVLLEPSSRPADPSRVDVFSALVHRGGIHTAGFDDEPGVLQALDLDASCFVKIGQGQRVSIRSVAAAEGVSWLDRGIRGNLAQGGFSNPPIGGAPKLLGNRDLLFYSLGSGGVLCLDVTDRSMREVIGVFQKKGHTVFRLMADPRTGRLFAGGSDEAGKPVVDVWDIARANGTPEQSNGNGAPVPGADDSRLLLSVNAPWDSNHIALDDSGTGLLFTWGANGAGSVGGFSIPIETPHFTFAGLYLPSDSEGGATANPPRPITRIAGRLQPLGSPTRVNVQDESDAQLRKTSETLATAAFKIRLALPGKLGDSTLDFDEVTAKVQTLRVRPEDTLLARENLGRAIAMPGGSAWPNRDVYVTLRRIGKTTTGGTGGTGGSADLSENGRLAVGYNLYESKEVVLLLADPRARREYRSTTASGGDASSESLQCRRCDRPDYLKGFEDGSVKELLAGGPFVRAFLSVNPEASVETRNKTQKLLDFFGGVSAAPANDAYRLPTGTVAVDAWADEVPSPTQASLAEPAQNAAAFSPGEAGVNVSLVAGDVMLHATDHSAAGRALSFAFDRTYRSGMAGYGPLGSAGWGANLFAHLRIIPAIEDLGYLGEIEYHDGGGNVFRFSPPDGANSCPTNSEYDGEGSFCVPMGLYVHLQRLQAGKGYRLISRQHGIVSFDERGLLVDGSDRYRRGDEDPDAKGNTLKFGYDGFGTLVHVEDDLGRPYKLIYKDDPIGDGSSYGLLSKITDFEGREISYTYDTGGERLLRSVTLPGVTNPFYPAFNVPSPELKYSYADPGLAVSAPLHEKFGKLKLQSFTLPGGTVPRAQVSYLPESGRTATVQFPASITWRLDYLGPADGAATGATVRAPWANPTTYVFAQGRIATKTETREVVAPKAFNSNIQTVVTTHSYTDDGRTKSILWPDGSLTNYCYGDVGSGTCPSFAETDLLSRPNVVKITRARGSAPKGTAQHEDEVPTSLSYNEDNLADGGSDPLGRPVSQAVPMASAADVPSGYPGEGVGGKSTFDKRGRLTGFVSGLDRLSPGPYSTNLGSKVNVSLVYDEQKGSPSYGRLVQMARGGIGESYLYDRVGNLTQKTTTYGSRSEMSYDEWDRQIQSSEGTSVVLADVPPEIALANVAGVLVQRAYDPAGHLVRERRNQDPYGWVETQYVYNAREQLVGVLQAKLAKDTLDQTVIGDPVLVQQNNYDPVTGLLTSTTTGEGLVTTYGYDSAGRIAATQVGLPPGPLNPTPDTSIKRRGYDLMGRPSLSTDDADNVKWRGLYDAWGRLFREFLPTGAVHEREFDKAGGVLRETTLDRDPEPVGATPVKLAETRMKLNAFGAATEVRELLKPTDGTQAEVIRLTKRTYDTNGRVVVDESGPEAGPLRPESIIDYEDGTGRIAKQRDAAGNETVFSYAQAASWPTKVTQKETVPGSPTLIETAFAKTFRDALGRVVREEHRSGEILEIAYDQSGNVLSKKTGTGVTTSSVYDGGGNPLSVERPNGRGKTLYAYDRDGRVIVRRSTAASGLTAADTLYTYDKTNGRLMGIKRPDNTVESFKYNLDDTLDVQTTRTGIQVKHRYDDANRLLSRTPVGPAGGASASLILDGGETYEYDLLSRLTKVQRLGPGAGSTAAPAADPAATILFQNYDTAGRPEKEVVGQDAFARPPVVRSYDVFDRPAGITLPAGVGRDVSGAFTGYGRAYDSLDRLTSLCANPSLPVGQGACVNDQGAVGANWAWGGTGRLYGITTKGAMKTAHRFGYISGPGAQPPSGNLAGDFRLGTLTIGSTLQDATSFSTQALDSSWGRYGYGYRNGDGVKLGRAVVSTAPGGTVGDPNSLQLHSSQGWAWGVDNSFRLTEAQSGSGSLQGASVTSAVRRIEGFHFGYGEGDEVQKIWRDISGETNDFLSGSEGRVTKRNTADFRYDAEGRRLEDDRATYAWTWRGELAVVTLKDTAPSVFAGHQIRYGYDAMGRLLSRTQLAKLPAGVTDDSQRPFIEKREYLWDGDSLLSEVAKSQDGALRWRKSYVPGASGLDDAVQVKVETYDATSATLQATKLYSYLRDEQGTVTGLVEEKEGATDADRAKPPLLARYFYDPYGSAHVELSPELYSAGFDKAVSGVTTASGSAVQQTISGPAIVGGVRLVFSSVIDSTTFAAGIAVERRLTDGTWGALTAQELAIGREPLRAEELILLPVAGWLKDATYRVRFLSGLKDTGGRVVGSAPPVAFVVPPSGDVEYQRNFDLVYDSALTAANELGGVFPGGQSALFQGLYTDPVTGLAFARARWLDSRNAAWLQEDPADDADSPNRFAFVGNRPNGFTDPTGELGFGDIEDVSKFFVSSVAQSFGASQTSGDNIGNFTISATETFAKTVGAIGAVGVVGGVCPPCGIALGTYMIGDGLAKAVERRLVTGQNLYQAGAGAVGDFTGASDIYAGIANKDLITQENLGLTDYERAGRLGNGVGTVASFSLGPKVLKEGAKLGERGRAFGEMAYAEAKARFNAPGDSSGGWPSIVPEGGWELQGEMPGGCNSFLIGTNVSTAKGSEPIEELSPTDDSVLAFDIAVGEKTDRKVDKSMWHLSDDVLGLFVGGEELQVTAQHPFWTDKGWIEAGKLSTDSKVFSLASGWLPVERVESRTGRFMVFNLEVEEDHDYFVGKNSVLVHNAGCGSKVAWNNGYRTPNGKYGSPLGPGKSGAAAEQGVWDAIKQNKPGWNVVEGRVSVRDPAGTLRVYDGAAISPRGRVIGLEVKSGTARKTGPQRTFDQWLNRSTNNVAKGVGESRGTNVRRVVTIEVP